MHRLPYVFTILKYCGIWRPVEWSSGWRRNIYWLYTTVAIVSMYTFSLSQAIYSFQYINDMEEIAASLFMVFTIACVICKAINILNKRRDIMSFENVFENDNCRPNGPDEIDILLKSDTRIKQTTLWYVTTLGLSLVAGWTRSFFIDVPRRKLNFNAWMPFNYTTTPTLYWSAYLYQIFSQYVCVYISIAYDAHLWGLIMQACTQLKILKFRLEFMPRIVLEEMHQEKKLYHVKSAQETENRVLARCINQHHEIFHFTESVNSTFSVVLFLQCAVSTFALCISIYVLSGTKYATAEFTTTFFFTCCLLTQIFVYCWFGTEIIVESMDVGNAVYAMDWSKLSVKTQKNLVVLMICSIRPIRFTTINVIVLSLDTFISLLKLSYSSFNLLQQTSQRQ